jgi:hypothetical protein
MFSVFYTNYLSTHLFCKRKISNCQLPGTNIIKNNLIFFSLKTMRYIENYRTEVPKWWVATQKWVAGPEFLTLDSMRAPKFRHYRWVATRLSLRTNAIEKLLKHCFSVLKLHCIVKNICLSEISLLIDLNLISVSF